MRSNLCDLGVAACVVNKGRILLIKESKGPHSSKWGVPKGFVESGELPAQAALRELFEECLMISISTKSSFRQDRC